MDKVVSVGQNVFNKYNQLIIQPNSIANPSVYTFAKDNMIFVVESGAAGLMGHSHNLFEVGKVHPQAIISFKMANEYLHEHESTYFIAQKDYSYAIYVINNGVLNEKLINMSSEIMLHAHSLKIREIFKDSVRIFSDYRDIQIISDEKYTFEIQMDEGVLAEHTHDIIRLNINECKKQSKLFRKAKVAFSFQPAMFHCHSGIYYIEKKDGKFIIKCDQMDGPIDKTTVDDKIKKHDHNIKLVRVTKRASNKNVLLSDPVPEHVAGEIINAAKMLMQLS